MPVSPIDVATDGYLNSPLSVAVDGYLTVTLQPVPEVPGGGGGKGKLRGLEPPKYYTVTPQRLDDLQAQLEREDDEILTIVMVAMEVIQ